MQKYVLLFISSVFSVYCHAQINDDENPACHEKCSRARSTTIEQKLAYFQYPSMDKYDVKYLKLDLAVEANSRIISGTALTRVKALQPLDTFITELRNNMIVDSVFVNNVKLNFQRASDHVFISLSPVIPASTDRKSTRLNSSHRL